MEIPQHHICICVKLKMSKIYMSSSHKRIRDGGATSDAVKVLSVCMQYVCMIKKNQEIEVENNYGGRGFRPFFSFFEIHSWIYYCAVRLIMLCYCCNLTCGLSWISNIPLLELGGLMDFKPFLRI